MWQSERTSHEYVSLTNYTQIVHHVSVGNDNDNEICR